MEHDWKKFPELRTEEFAELYFQSPHKQITEDFLARVVKVHDGDTLTLRWSEREFDFPLRFLIINAPELNEYGGHEARSWLENQLLDQDVMIHIDPTNRVEKWGRLLGSVYFNGLNIGELEMMMGFAKPIEKKMEGMIPDFSVQMGKEGKKLKW
jgi:endonuclease YncB( thermonuclease family)